MAAHPTGVGTLGRRLLARVVAVVIVVAVALAGATTLGTRHILSNQLDRQLDTAAARQIDHPASGTCTTTAGQGPAPGSDVLGNLLGSVFVAKCANGQVAASIVAEGRVDPDFASSFSDAARQLLTVASDGHKRDITLTGLGAYRVMSTTRDGTVYVVALPMASVDRAVEALLLLEAGLTVLALTAAGVICRSVIINSLKPLNRLAAAANQVSELDLDSGEVDLPVRVSNTLSDPGTEVGQVGSAFNHMLNNVEGALEARQRSETKVRQFVADASHELRNPLASIRGYAELCQRSSSELPDDVQHALNRIQAQATRMSGLVEDMLLLARLDNDQQLTLAPTDLVEVVLNAVSDSRMIEADHTWILNLPDAPVMVNADKNRLMQAIVNVLSNARKHTPAGTTVTTSVTWDDDVAAVTVADDGPGIPEAVRATAFERFARADTARTASKEGSTGLGLSIVAALMEAHHGSATVDTGAGGTTVTLSLPRHWEALPRH